MLCEATNLTSVGCKDDNADDGNDDDDDDDNDDNDNTFDK